MSFIARTAVRQLARAAPSRAFSVMARSAAITQVPRAVASKVNHLDIFLLDPNNYSDQILRIIKSAKNILGFKQDH